jgi:hypothetical protein
MWGWILAGLIALFLVRLALSTVLSWFQENRTVTSEYGELLKERLSSGKYRIIGGIFDKRGLKTAEHMWETDKLDDDLRQYFGNRDKVRVEL